MESMALALSANSQRLFQILIFARMIIPLLIVFNY